MGIDTPGVEELPRGDETSGGTPEGDGVPGEDGQGRGGGGPPPTNQETEANRDSGGNEEMTSGPGTAALTSPHRGTAAGIGSGVKP